jgi:hypothetical protein
MNLVALYYTTKGDVTITLIRQDGVSGFALSRNDWGEAVLAATVLDSAEHWDGEAAGHAYLFARSPTMLHLLGDALALFATEFAADEDMPGADLVDRFAEWRSRAKAELAAPI